MGKFIDKLIEKFASDIIDRKVQNKVDELIKDAEITLLDVKDKLNDGDDDSTNIDMTELDSLFNSLENLNKQLNELNEDPDSNASEIKELEIEFMYIMDRVEQLLLDIDIYQQPLDESGEVQWVPYVFDNKNTFVHYLLGKQLTFQPLIQIFTKTINGLRDENGFDDNEYKKHIFGLIDEGAFPLLFENVDFAMSSTKYTGLLPDGSHVDDVDTEKTLDIISESLSLMQPNSISSAIESGTVDMRLKSLNNLLNISCPFCGVPHEFEGIDDIPETTFRCTMCDKVLVQYME